MESGLKQKLTCVALASAFGLAASMPSFAQQGRSATSDAKADHAVSKVAADATQSGRDVCASKIIGKDVENAQATTSVESKA